MKYEIEGKEIHIYFEHNRCKEGDDLSNRGGKTVAYVIDKKTGMITKGEAVCSKKDIYSKKLGRIIATGRLFKKLNMPTKDALYLCKHIK